MFYRTATPYGRWLSILMNLGGIAGLTTVGMTLVLSQTRFFYAMAHDGLLPHIFAKLHRKTNTPWISTLICGIFCALFSGFCPVDILGETTSISALIIYIFAHVSVVVMRFTHKDMPRGFKVPCGKWLIPTVGSLLCVLLLKGISKATGFRFLAWTLLGQVIYFLHGFWHSRAGLFATNRSTTSMAELPVNLEDNLGADPPNEFEMDLASVYAGDQAQTTNHPDIDK
ncbi:unnamed protein product, partial [Rotaria magnacalcarata]